MSTKSGHMSIIPSRAIDDRRLSHAAMRVLGALGTYGDRNGWCYPSQVTISKRLGVTSAAINQHIKTLAELGYIEKKRRYNDGAETSCLYRILFDVIDPDVPDYEDDACAEDEKGGGISKLLTPPISKLLTGGVSKLLIQNDSVNGSVNVPINGPEEEEGIARNKIVDVIYDEPTPKTKTTTTQAPYNPSPDIYAVDVYASITGMLAIPGKREDHQHVIDALMTVNMRHTGKKQLMAYLQPYYKEWIKRGYAKTNNAWLTDWAISGEVPPAKMTRGAAPQGGDYGELILR